VSGLARPIEGVLRFFAYDHLPEHLQAVSQPFSELAHQIADRSRSDWEQVAADGPETTVALRKLLEAKDAAVRAVLPR
jgi:hypothetical protein